MVLGCRFIWPAGDEGTLRKVAEEAVGVKESTENEKGEEIQNRTEITRPEGHGRLEDLTSTEDTHDERTKSDREE